jgi:uncharacterized oxidoreductase
MPKLGHEYLRSLAFHIFQAVGAPAEEAKIVATHLVNANLAGHDSHGIIQVSNYVERIRKGEIRPGAAFKISKETPTTVSVDGNWGFGFVVTEKVMGMVIKKAKAQNVAAGAVAHQGHIGRLTDYALMAAREGLIGLITADSGKTAKPVAPFGGREPRIGTNPICIALPSSLEGPVFIDFATSAVAGNKLLVAASRGEEVAPGLISDKDGSPTTDPKDYFAGGMLLPLGGAQGRKGYGLGFMVEVFTSLLTGLGFGYDPKGRHNDGVFMAAFNVSAFRPLDEFKREVAGFVAYVKSAKPAKGFTEVLYPGEPEWRTEQKRRKEGIFVEDTTWQKLQGLVEELKLERKLGQAVDIS